MPKKLHRGPLLWRQSASSIGRRVLSLFLASWIAVLPAFGSVLNLHPSKTPGFVAICKQIPFQEQALSAKVLQTLHPIESPAETAALDQALDRSRRSEPSNSQIETPWAWLYKWTPSGIWESVQEAGRWVVWSHIWLLTGAGGASAGGAPRRPATRLPEPLARRVRAIADRRSHERYQFGAKRRILWRELTRTEKQTLLEAVATQKRLKRRERREAIQLQSDRKLMRQAILNLVLSSDLGDVLEPLGATPRGLLREYVERSEALRKEGVIKTPRWLLLEELGYVRRDLLSIEKLRTSADLLLLLKEGALQQIPWELVFSANPPLSRAWVRELGTQAFPGEIKGGMSAKDLRSVLLKLLERHYRNENLTSLGPRALWDFYKYADTLPDERTTARFIVDRFFPVEENLTVRPVRKAYTLDALRVLRDNGFLAARRVPNMWGEEGGLPNSGRRALLQEAGMEAKQPLDEGPLTQYRYQLTIAPSLNRSLTGLLQHSLSRRNGKLAGVPLTEHVLEDTGFLRDEASLLSALERVQSGFNLFSNTAGSSLLARTPALSRASETLRKLKQERDSARLRQALDEGMLAADAALTQTSDPAAVETILRWRQSLEAYWQILDTAEWTPSRFATLVTKWPAPGHAKNETAYARALGAFPMWRAQEPQGELVSRIFQLIEVYQQNAKDTKRMEVWQDLTRLVHEHPDSRLLCQAIAESVNPIVRAFLKTEAANNLLFHLQKSPRAKAERGRFLPLPRLLAGEELSLGYVGVSQVMPEIEPGMLQAIALFLMRWGIYRANESQVRWLEGHADLLRVTLGLEHVPFSFRVMAKAAPGESYIVRRALYEKVAELVSWPESKDPQFHRFEITPSSLNRHELEKREHWLFEDFRQNAYLRAFDNALRNHGAIMPSLRAGTERITVEVRPHRMEEQTVFDRPTDGAHATILLAPTFYQPGIVAQFTEAVAWLQHGSEAEQSLITTEFVISMVRFARFMDVLAILTAMEGMGPYFAEALRREVHAWNSSFIERHFDGNHDMEAGLLSVFGGRQAVLRAVNSLLAEVKKRFGKDILRDPDGQVGHFLPLPGIHWRLAASPMNASA